MKTDKMKMQIAIARKKMTSMQLADAAGLSTVTVGRLLGGASVAPITAGKVAEALGVDVTDIIDMEEVAVQ